MQAVSSDYKRDISKKLRNRSFMKVTVGVINQLAQRNAEIEFPDNYLYLSNFTRFLNGYVADPFYATGEQNFAKVDGSMYFAPPDRQDALLNQGVISKNTMGEITISFDYEYDLQGLTIDFGIYQPVSFQIITKNETYQIDNNQDTYYRFEEVIQGTDFVTIKPLQMVGGQQRLRITRFWAGLGLVFNNNDIIDSTKDEFISPLSEELPAINLDLTIDNRSHKFDIENNLSSVNFLENGQQVVAEYGYELDNGKTEWMTGATLFLDTWDADDTEMSFSAIDRFAKMNGTFYKGKYRADGISLYDLALEVISDADIDPRDYELDEYLKSIIVYNPIPVVTHAEALQMIANAGRCILYQDRSGKIYIKLSLSARRLPDMIASANEQHMFSQVSNILSPDPKNHYAVGNENYSRVNGSVYFLPGGSTQLKTGFMSSHASDEDGKFIVNPRIRIDLEGSYKSYGFQIYFAGNHPITIKLYSYLVDELQEEYEVEVESNDLIIDHEFPELDRLDIEVIEGCPNNNVYIDSVVFGEVTDYALTYDTELTQVPKGTLLNTTKDLYQSITIFSETSEADKEDYSETIEITGDETPITVTLSNASYNLSAKVGEQNAAILESGAYYAVIEIPQGLSGTQKVSVTGKEYLVNSKTFIYTLNRTGETVKFENPLISYRDLAEEVTEWEGDYYFANKEYDIEYRGEPRIDANDIVFLENKVVPNMLVRIYSHVLNFSGGALSGSITARRDMYVDRTESRLDGLRLFQSV